jgi:protein TonB
MALIVGLGGWYAVSAFPLHTDYQSITDQKMEPGPLELKAHAVTPENSIPRRIHFEALVLPDSIAPVRGSVGVRITLDDVGRIAEARPIEFSLKSANYTMSMSGITAIVKMESSTPNLKEDVFGVLDAAVQSVRQWRYDPPVEAPLSFTVQVRVSSGPEVMEFKPARENGALRVGGEIKSPIKIKDVRPVYPPLALESNLTGVVIVEVRIGTDGYVEEAHVLKSIPLLDQAALDAVKQWQFTPTLMNGQPTPLIMTVTVNFTQQ